MDATQAHIFLNYIPLTGTVIGIVMLVIGIWKKSGRFTRTGLALFIMTALLTLAVYATGEIAGKGSDQMVGQLWANILEHRASALPTFAVVELTGILGLIGLVKMLRGGVLSSWYIAVVLVLSVASVGLAARTTHFGRRIFTFEMPASPSATALGQPRPQKAKEIEQKYYNTEIKLWHA